MARLVDLYRTAGLNSNVAQGTGRSAALYQVGSTLARRRRLLEQNIRSGIVKPDQLGAADKNLVGQGLASLDPRADLGGGFLGDVGGFFGNLGKDIGDFGKGFLPGLWEQGKSIAKTIGEGGGSDPFSGLAQGTVKTWNKPGYVGETVIKPQAETFARDFSNIAHGRWNELYEHPLSPILSVASVASLGGGAAARAGRFGLARTEAESGLGRLSTRATSLNDRDIPLFSTDRLAQRPAISLGSTDIRRRYTPTTMGKIGQSALDALSLSRRMGNVPGVGRFINQDTPILGVRRRTVGKEMLSDFSTMEAQRSSVLANPVYFEISKAFKDLTEPESTAMWLAMRGINTPERLDALAELWGKSIRGEAPEGFNLNETVPELMSDPVKASQAVAHVQKNISDLMNPDVRELVINNTDKMVDAAEKWSRDVYHGMEDLEIPDEIHNERIQQSQKFLDEFRGEEGGTNPLGIRIEPTYVPDRNIIDMEWKSPGIKGRFLNKEGELVPKLRERVPPERTQENLFRSDTTPSYLHKSSGATFLSGAFRTDNKILLDHIKQRQQDLVDKVYKREVVEKWAVKEADPETGEIKSVRAKNTSEMQKKGYNNVDYALVHTDFPWQFFKNEDDMLKGVVARGHKLVDEGILPDTPEFVKQIEAYIADNAHQFTRQIQGVIRRPGYVVPRQFYEYQKKLFGVHDPFIPGVQWMVNAQRVWRSFTLSFMPRWAMNTAVGSFLQAIVSGAINPREYWLGFQMNKAGELPAGSVLGKSALSHEVGGIVGKRSEYIASKVQAIEDFFRGGVFVHMMKKEDRRAMAEMGETIKSYYEHGLSERQRLNQIIHELGPEGIRDIVDDTNRFMYNYTHLGPVERRYVRQIVPFWGWYKFITKLAWRLPAEYPGRTYLMANISAIGNEHLAENGAVPEWLKGALILANVGGQLTYISGMGSNPFSSFANPLALFSEHGGLKDLITLGQASPFLQAGLAGFGIDSMTGGPVRVSPESGVGRGIFGTMIDPQTGEEVPAGQVEWAPRIAGQLLRSFPQYRILEKQFMGGTQYPESIPFINPKMPMTPAPPKSGGQFLRDLGLSFLGWDPRSYDLQGYQQLRESQKQYARTRMQSELLRKRRQLTNP